MAQKYDFSIAIAVYNTEIKLLTECFDSVKNIDYNNYEVIVVDDCSSISAVSTYCKKICQINQWKYIKHKNNLGLGPARNTSIQNAAGGVI